MPAKDSFGVQDRAVDEASNRASRLPAEGTKLTPPLEFSPLERSVHVRAMVRLSTVALAILCLIALLSPVPAEAREKQVIMSGRVMDTLGRPVRSALISIPAINESTTTDDQGAYRLVIRAKIRSGEAVVVRASRKGFDYVSRSVRLTAGARLTINFRLTAAR
jgi:hypothetical protein